MHITHGLHMHTLHIMITLILMCMLECTNVHICGCKGHLARFCYDRVNSLNFANKNVWVSNNTNPRGFTRKWVPKSPPLVFDVGVGSHMT